MRLRSGRPAARHRFLTTWLLDAPREDVYDALWDSEAWPGWWRGVEEAVETYPGAACGIGRRGNYVWRSRIPYPVRFEVVATEVERPWLLAGEASGDLAGTGVWRLFEEDGFTAATYSWSVRATNPWLAAIGVAATPVVRWNHDVVMRWGGKGLAEHLGCRLLAAG